MGHQRKALLGQGSRGVAGGGSETATDRDIGMTPPNPSQGSVVKRADVCTTGAEWLSVEQTVKHLRQAIAADFIAVAGHSL
jgi:hypothetical protein